MPPTLLLFGGHDAGQSTLGVALAAAGFTVSTVPDLAACQTHLELFKPDIVVAQVPERGGNATALVGHLCSDSRSPDTVVAVLSAGSDAADRCATVAAGADICLPASTPPVELVAALTACLRRKVTIDALRASESQLRVIVETEPECVKVVALDGRLLDMNPAGLRMIEARNRKDVIGCPVEDLVHPDDRAAFLNLHRRSASGETGRLQFRIVGLAGKMLWMDTHSAPLRAADGTINAVISVTHDMTERRRAEDALQQSEARFRELADNLRDVFYIVEPGSGQTLYVSPAYEQIWQRTRDSLYQVPFSDHEAVHPEDLPLVVEANRQQQQGLPTDIEYRIRWPNGEVRWIRDHSSPVPGPAGTVNRIVGTAWDVTEHKLAGDRVREQASLLDKATDAIMVRDLNQRITYWNCGAERMYGWSAAEAVGCPVRDLLPTDEQAFQAACDHVMATGEWAGELRQQARPARAITVEARWTLMRTPLGEPQSILAIETDVTDRKLLELQFLRAQRMESIGTLAGGIAHDLNNILTPIMLSIELLTESVTDDAGRALLSTIGASARRGAEVVGQVLSFARGIGGQRVIVAPAQVVAEVGAIVRKTFPQDIRLHIACDPGAWTVLGNPTQLHQVLLNLCVNARDAMGEGGDLTLAATNTVIDERAAALNIDARPGPFVLLRVEDSGTGIPPNVLERIFDPFFTTKEVGRGTGLGLSTALAIVKGHGGFIRCDSTIGQGTRFNIHLPAQFKAVDEAAADRVPAPLLRGDGQTVLIIDDDETIRQIARLTLEAFGYCVLEAANGREAVAIYRQHHVSIDLVLVDMMMPGMDGPATIQELVRINPVVVIVATSGAATDASRASAAAAGARHFLPKPFAAEGLRSILHRTPSNGDSAPYS